MPTPAQTPTTTTKADDIPPNVEAIRIYKQETGKKVNETQAAAIEKAVSTDAPALSLWRDVVRGHLMQGWAAGNVACMLDYYGRGEVPGRSNGQHSNTGPPAQSSEPLIIPGLDAMPVWENST